MANVDVQTVGQGADRAKLAIAAVLAAGGFVAFYMLAKSGALIQWGALITLLLAGAVVFFISNAGKSLVGFARDAWREAQKVVWPTRKETLQMTLYVFAFVVVMALFLWLTDKTLEWLLYDLILGWKK